jgi:hypothetical protein
MLTVPKSDLCIPRNETARPHSNYYINVSVSDLYFSRIGLPIWLQQNRQTDPVNISLTDTSCGNWETEYYNSVLERMRPGSFISGNTKIGRRHLYWIFTISSFEVFISY